MATVLACRRLASTPLCPGEYAVRLGIAFAFIFSLGFAANVVAGPADDAFTKFVDDYFEAYFRNAPSAGTAVGLHQFDDKIEDLSKPQIEARIVEVKGLLGRLTAINRAELSFDNAIDAAVLEGQMNAELLDSEALRTWQANPTNYIGLPGSAIDVTAAHAREGGRVALRRRPASANSARERRAVSSRTSHTVRCSSSRWSAWLAAVSSDGVRSRSAGVVCSPRSSI